MDDGPFRVPRPANRSAPVRPEPEPAPQPPEVPQPVIKEEPKIVHRTAPNRIEPEEKSRKRFILPFIAVAIIALGVIGWFTWSGLHNAGTAIDSGKYQAVFFTNGQVYFGKLHAFNDNYMKLTEVFYLQAKASEDTDSENPQQSSTAQNNTTLIKLGEEIHGPEDEMIISKDQVLFYENLKADGKVSSTIAEYNKTKK